MNSLKIPNIIVETHGSEGEEEEEERHLNSASGPISDSPPFIASIDRESSHGCQQATQQRLEQLELDLVQSNEQFELAKSRLFALESELADARQVNMELATTKQLLSEEIVELTKALFEEANGMVANEARARSGLETQRRKLQLELDHTKERLKLESMQLAELRARLYAFSAEDGQEILAMFKDKPPAEPMDRPPFTVADLEAEVFSGFTFHYFEDLFPERRFDSKSKRNGRVGYIWEEIIQKVDEATFDSFAKFIDKCSGLDDDSFLDHAFMKKCFETDVAACLHFDCKPRAFLKRIAKAMLTNSCYIERIPGAGSGLDSKLGSRPQSVLTAATNTISTCSRGDTDDRSIQLVESFPPTSSSHATKKGPSMMTRIHGNRPDSPMSVASCEGRPKSKGFVNQFSWSVSSLPDMHVELLDHIDVSPVKKIGAFTIEDRPSGGFCGLCGNKSSIDSPTLLYRFKLTDKEPYMLIDTPCREKLVAAGDFYTFIRHLRRGLFHQRPIIDLYFELLHYKRNMFYARTGSTAFFIQSDFERYSKHYISYMKENKSWIASPKYHQQSEQIKEKHPSEDELDDNIRRLEVMALNEL